MDQRITYRGIVMDTLIVLAWIVSIGSLLLNIVLCRAIIKHQKTIAFLEEDVRLWKREKSLQRLAENLTTVSESTKEREHILQISSEKEKLSDKSSDLGPRTSAL